MQKIIPYHKEISETLISENNRPIPLKILYQKCQKKYKIYNFALFQKSINLMIEDGEIRELSKTKSLVIKHLISDEIIKSEKYIGIIKINSKQNGFVNLLDEKEAKFFIPKIKLNGALDGDKVEISPLKTYITNNSKISNFKDAVVNKILEHKKDYYTGTFRSTHPNEYKIEVDDSKFYYDVKIDDINGLTNGTKILFHVNEFSNDIAKSSIIKIIGHESDVGNDILSLVYNSGIEPEFSDEIINISNNLKVFWDEKKDKYRRDLRNKNFITIDPESSKDFDDSIFVKKSYDGNYILNVAIADVGHYVRYSSLLSNEALKRGTSVYLTDRVIPMYPHKISDDICSLNPGVDRLTMNCEITIDSNGNFKNIDAYPGIINSKRRFSYDEVNEFFNKTNNLENDSSEIKQMLNISYELHKILRNKKKEEGYIDFEIKEPIIVVDEKGKPIEIKIYESGEAQRMIEDFMIAANEAITIFAIKNKLPFIYRTHENPDPLKIEELNKLLKRINFNSRLDIKNITSKRISNWLKENENHKMIDIARKVLLQSMSKAKYSDELKRHFGIASENYTHFTSPIRRYPDTIISQILHMYLFNKDEYTDKDRQDIKNELKKFAELANEKEIIATRLGFDVNEMKFAEYMENYLNKKFIGMIVSINNFGAFVQLDNTIEGLIHITNMNNDFYTYNEETSSLIGKNTRQELHIGDIVEVEVINSDKNTKKIDFALIKKLR